MTVRVPPGRMGIVWLRERLEVAERARAVLEREVEALNRDLAEAELALSVAKEDWARALQHAEESLLASELVGGTEQVARVAAMTEPASVHITMQRTLGVTRPGGADIVPPPVAPAIWGNTSHLLFSAHAYRDALEAGAQFAAMSLAVRVVERERARMVRRLRSIERRWIPQLQEGLRNGSRTLDEAEREDTVRISWAARRRE